MPDTTHFSWGSAPIRDLISGYLAEENRHRIYRLVDHGYLSIIGCISSRRGQYVGPKHIHGMEWVNVCQAGEFKASITQINNRTGLQKSEYRMLLFKLFCSHIQITQALSRESFTTTHHHHICIYSISLERLFP